MTKTIIISVIAGMLVTFGLLAFSGRVVAYDPGTSQTYETDRSLIKEVLSNQSKILSKLDAIQSACSSRGR